VNSENLWYRSALSFFISTAKILVLGARSEIDGSAINVLVLVHVNELGAGRLVLRKNACVKHFNRFGFLLKSIEWHYNPRNPTEAAKSVD